MQTIQQKWEYAVEHPSNFEKLESALQQRGDEGWELVNVVAIPPADPASTKTLRVRQGQWYAFFKRPTAL